MSRLFIFLWTMGLVSYKNGGFISPLATVITTGTNISSDPNLVTFHLFPRNDDLLYNEALTFGNIESISSSSFKAGSDTIFLIHGFTQNWNSTFPTNVKNAYLKAGFASRANIIVVDWGHLSASDCDVTNGNSSLLAQVASSTDIEILPEYVSAKNNVPIVGKRIKDFIVFLIQNNLISGQDKVHLVGQSLGAHVAGVAGNLYVTEGAGAGGLKLYRITGLDPAGPGFQGLPIESRLDETDADFVDTVRANMGIFGYVGKVGHVDFIMNVYKPVQIQEVCLCEAVSEPFCSHDMAPIYFAESVLNPRIQGQTISSCWFKFYFCQIGQGGNATFGQYTPQSARGTYLVKLRMQPQDA